MLEQRDLQRDLERMGIGAGDTVVVHSSMRSIGKVEGGAASVVGALLSVVGGSGHAVFPTFTFGGSKPFDPEASPSTTGIITEIARQWPGAHRSWHPTHAVTVIGPFAEQMCAGHHLLGGLAKDSPLDRAAAAGGQILLLGVGHTSNSMIHVGESYAELPFAEVPFSPGASRTATIKTPDGLMEVPLVEPPGCSRGFGEIEPLLRRRQAIVDGTVGEARSQLLPAQVLIDEVVRLLESDPTALLCSDPRCYRCTRAREVVESGGS